MTQKNDLNLLAMFLEVYRLKSITLAAQKLELTQAAVSSAMKRLSQRCQHELFLRQGRGIIATDFAVQLANKIAPAIDSVGHTFAQFSGFDPQQSGFEFRISAIEVIANLLLPAIEALCKTIQLNISLVQAPSNHTELINALRLEQFDIAIDTATNREKGFVYQPIFTEDIVLICRKGHPRIKNSISLEQYYTERHITLRLRRSNLSAVEYYASEQIAERKIAMESSSLLQQIAQVAQSDCIGACSRHLALKYADQFQINILPMPLTLAKVEYCLIWHQRMNDKPAHIWLRNQLGLLFSELNINTN
ncbi:LysR family transcriptional regulator [Alginatibacterium sediminis]|uniref:LysR family transcriptional regulator n=1 Tax=Alginatibacterium sediminis TaxID=2164068 RepID=A0A420EGB2_9ALTE|nr:LysR family transcriptional regulator [Alginatibacterium sediminis]RKF19717.1 LysR family transcriptional regulator [Alginatibacterium sediminis]